MGELGDYIHFRKKTGAISLTPKGKFRIFSPSFDATMEIMEREQRLCEEKRKRTLKGIFVKVWA